MRPSLTGGVGAALILVMGLPASALTLHEAAVQTLDNNPRLAAARDSIRAAAAGIDAAQSGFRPNASFSTALTYQRYEFQSRSAVPPGFPLPETLLPASVILSVSQPLYTGGWTTAQVETSRQQFEEARQTRSGMEQTLLLATVTVYLDVIRDRAVLRLEDANARMLTQALADARLRFDTGVATRTDTAAAEARLAGAQARQTRAQTALRISEASFRRIIGLPPDQIVDTWPNPRIPPSLEAALRTIGDIPTMQAAMARWRAAQAQIEAARAGHRPTLAVESQIGEQNDSEFPLNSYHTWSVQLKANLPLYQGGLIEAKVAQARALADQAADTIDDIRHAAIESTTQAWSALQATDQVIRADEAAVTANEQALNNTQRELAMGLRTTLNLLDAERDKLAAEVDLVASRRDRAVAAYQVLAATGTLQLDDVR